MRLTRLRVENFLGLRSVDLEFEHLTIIVGRNGSGKTSIRDAVLFAVTGRARSTDAAGRGADKLVRNQVASMKVRLDVDADGPASFSRSWSAGKVTGSGPKLDIDADTIEAVMDVPYLLTVDAKTRSGMLSRLICPPVDLKELAQLAADDGAVPSVVSSLVAGLSRDGLTTVGPVDLETAYKRAYERRRELKRDLEAARARVDAAEVTDGPVPTAAEIQAAAHVLAENEAEYKRTVAEAADLRAKAEELDRLVVELGQLNEQLDAAGAEPEQATLAFGPGKSPMELEIVARKARGEFERAEADFVAQSGKVHAAQQVLKVAQEDRAAAESGSVACPSIHAPAACPLSEAGLAAQKARIPELKAAEKAAAAKVKKEQTAAAAAEAAMNDARQRLAEAVASQATADRAAAEARGARSGQREQLARRAQQVEERIDQIGDVAGVAAAAAERVEDLDFQLSLDRERLAEMKRRADAAASRATDERAAGELAAKVGTLEGIVSLLEPKGLPARLTEGRSAAFADSVNGILNELTQGEYGIELLAGAKGVELLVHRNGTDRALPPENLSTSERLRLGLSLAQAVCVIRQLPLIIDDSEILDSVGKKALSKAVPALLSRIESVVIIATADEAKTVSAPGRAVYWVEDGTVRLVEAQAGVNA